MNRRKFLINIGIILGGNSLVGYGYYYNKKNEEEGMDNIPEGKILVDSHAHFHGQNDPQRLVDAFFNSDVTIQTICDFNNNGDYLTLEKIKEGIKEDIILSDKYAFVVKKGEDIRIFLQGREYENPGLHVVVEGECTEKEAYKNKEAIIAHPFAVECSYGYRNPNQNEMSSLYSIAEDYDILIEGGNSMCTLWMIGANQKARNFAKKIGRSLIFNTDAHPCLEERFAIKQIGRMGTLIPRFDIKSLNGKEILKLKNQFVREQGEKYGSPLNAWIFGNVMIRRKLE